MATLKRLLEAGPEKGFQPHADHIHSRSDILERLATMVGCVALGLPVILAVGVSATNDCFRDSISQFYYTQSFGAVFVGLLCFIGGFLIAYTGESRLERMGSNIAGIGALAVAFFPVAGSGCEAESFPARVFAAVSPNAQTPISQHAGTEFFSLFSTVSDYHVAGAGILFTYLGLFCLVVLKRVVPQRHVQNGALIETKANRNRLYSYCGLTILACVAILGLKGLFLSEQGIRTWNLYNVTFIFESLALYAFGIAWFAKGRVFTRLNDAEM